MSLFIAENARLRNTIESNKRVITALRIRHVIAKLVGELPQDRYPGQKVGPKWKLFWVHIWDDAEKNPHNPFHQLYIRSTGQFDDRSIRRRGRQLYADISSEIHNCGGMNLEYKHFDFWIKEIGKLLVPKDDMRAGAVNWKREVRRYPVPGLPEYDPAEMDHDEDMIEGPPDVEDDEDDRRPVREHPAKTRRRRPAGERPARE